MYLITLLCLLGAQCLLDIASAADSDIVLAKDKAREMLSHEVKIVVDDHNKYRREEKAKDMEYMQYDTRLEAQIKDWLETCQFKHGFDEPTTYNLPWDNQGQNLYISSGDYANGTANIAGALAAWHNEINDYDRSAHTCASGKVCGHYTQMVWYKTTHVGCAYKYCSEVTDKDGVKSNNRHMIGCNYGPAGNMQGVKPFANGDTGDECTQCPSGYAECDNGLCRRCSVDGGSCVCKAKCFNCATAPTDAADCRCTCASGWHGPTCQTECKDHHSFCGNGWYTPQCTDMSSTWDVARKNCLAMCGLCETDNPKPEGSCGPVTSDIPIGNPTTTTGSPNGSGSSSTTTAGMATTLTLLAMLLTIVM